ncbi:MAG: 1-acyl-sn-glycerol-3-phosphate acyltransferase [Sphingobacteriia bacterium]|nr:1-acyl-sn-glycerol-3-phosphate acyltransferase [Sphingobacteriia bacterium]NCC38888.1 1-acyl-sn-glycerol-3-phosphate acyltransferase [Gammaproteobacteria bacterium]
MTLASSAWRALSILAHLGSAAALALWIRAITRIAARPRWVPRVMRWWHARLCAILDLQVSIHGRLEPGCLLVGNHVSWLDIPVIGAHGEVSFLAKSEVRGWPLIGWLAETAGTLFIVRGAHRIQTLAARLSEQISQGHTMMIFPEGTTSDGASVLRFHPRLFALAVETGVAIQPIAIRYRSADGELDTRVPFLGEETLLAHLMRLLRHPAPRVELHLLPPQPVNAVDRRDQLAERARRAILARLRAETRERVVDPGDAEVPRLTPALSTSPESIGVTDAS